jgi:aspartate kinase
MTVGFAFLVEFQDAAMIVMKFGGTSVEDAKAIQRVAQIVRGRLKRKPLVVVSAMAGVTDSLVRISNAAAEANLDIALAELQKVRQRHLVAAEELIAGDRLAPLLVEFDRHFDSLETLLRGVAAVGELSPRTTDLVLSYGEVLSSMLVAAAFQAIGLAAVHLDSRAVIVTDATYKSAQPLFEETGYRLSAKVPPLLAASRIPVMGGFIAATEAGETTTLGRGGSDYSAAIVGAALSADAIEIWTDVEGMLTTDPRICPDAQRIRTISFDEAAELAYFGAKVLHPATLLPAVQRDIPVYILNSRKPRSSGTCVRSKVPPSRTTFRAIAAKKGSTVINLRAPRMLFASGFLRTMFDVLERHRCPVDLVSTSEVSVSLVVDPSHDVAGIVPELKQLGEVEVEPHKAIVCLVGKDIRGTVGIAASVFNVLAEAGVNIHMISQGASEINISVVIDEEAVPVAVKHLHAHFFPALSKSESRRRSPGSVLRASGSEKSFSLAASAAGDE